METISGNQITSVVNNYGFYVKNRNRFYSNLFHVYVTFFAVYVKTYT